MSDYDFPELPSDEELGITEEDRRQYGDDAADDAAGDGPEMTDAEMAALLGGSAPPGSPKGAPSPPAKAPSQPTPEEAKVRKQAAKEVKKAAKEVKKAEKQKSKEEAKAAKEQRRQEKEAARQQRRERRAARTEERKKGAEAEAALPGWRGPATLGLLLVFAVVASSRTGIPGPVPANAPDTVFSSARAMATLVELARLPHPPGSPEHARVRQMLVDRLTEMGMQPEVQTATSLLPAPVVRTPDGPVRMPDVLSSATVRNVVARLPGTDPSGTVLVTAHYDSRGIAVGAGDDGSGVVAILEALRAIRAGDPLANDVIVLFTDAEELGLLGAQAFVDQHPWMADVDLVLSFEMRGGGGPSIMFETNDRNGWVIQALASFDPAPFANSLFYDVYRRMPNDTDFTPFREAGVQGLNFAAIDRANVYHQAFDVPENVSEATLQHHGVHALSALRYFGAADLTSVDAPNRVYLSLPVVGLITYPQSVVLPISGVLVVLFVLLVGAALRGGARPGAMLAGFVTSLAAGAIAGGIGWVVFDQVSSRHAELGSLQGSLFHSEGWYMLAIAWAAFAAVVATVALARRWISRDEVAVGVLVLPLGAAIAASVFAPLAAMDLQWPVAAALVAALIGSLLARRAGGTVGWLTSLALAVPVVLILTPLVELTWLALTFRLAPALAALAAFGALMCAPTLEGLRRPNVWWSPLVAAGVAAACLATGVATARPGPSRPLPTTLVYAYAHGSGEALWATAPESDRPDAFEVTARAWAQTRAGGRFEETRDLAPFGYPFGEVPVHRADVVSAQPPSVEVVSDTVIGSERSVELAIRSLVGAEMLGFRLEGGTRVRALNGVAIADADQFRRINHWGEPDGAVRLQLTMPSTQAIGVHVVEHLLRPEEVLGQDAFARAEDLAPDISRLSDRAMFSYSVAAFVDPRFGSLRPTGPSGPAAAPDQTVGQPDSLAPAATDTAGTAPGEATDTVTAEPDTARIDTTRVDTTVVDTMATMDTLSQPRDGTESVETDTLRTHPLRPGLRPHR